MYSFHVKTIANYNNAGELAFKIGELGPRSTTTMNVTITPKLHGMYESTRAKMKYSGGSGEIDVDAESGDVLGTSKLGYSTSLGRLKIYSKAEHKRLTSYYAFEWSVFAAAFALITVVPFWLWSGLKSASSKQKPNK